MFTLEAKINQVINIKHKLIDHYGSGVAVNANQV